MELFYKQAAENWFECLPLGNGNMGMMLDGGTFREKIFLNDDTLWSGYPKPQGEPPLSSKNLDRIRGLLLKGHRLTAEKLLKATSQGEPAEAYMPFGTVFIDYKTEGAIGGYRRRLDLERALHVSKFNIDGNVVEKRCFCSYPDSSGIMNVRAVRKISFVISFNTHMPYETHVEKNIMYATGHAPDGATQTLSIPIAGSVAVPFGSAEYNGKGMAFVCGVKVETDGRVKDEGGALFVEDATNALIIFKTATGFKGYDLDPETRTETVKKKVKGFLAKSFDFEYMLDRHVNDYRALYKRVCFRLTTTDGAAAAADGDGGAYAAVDEGTPTDILAANAKRDGADARLVELYYNYGRYLLISSSRQGSEPANLQGVWNKDVKPPFLSGYTLGAALQMNYWCAASCNLPECFEPLFRFVGELSANGKKTAVGMLNASGFAAFFNSDIWRKTAPVRGDLSYSFFPMAGVWLTNELYNQYAHSKFYGEDAIGRETKRLYEITEDCCRFVNDWLTLYKGEYITCPSSSPELKYKRGFFSYSLDCASACDMALVWQLIENYKELCARAGVSSRLLTELTEKQAKLHFPSIGRDGRLNAWYGEYADVEECERHYSPLYCLYPGTRVDASNPGDKKLADACAEFLNNRIKNGGGATGRSAAWAISLFARLKDGESAYSALKRALEQFTFPNLFDKHPPNTFQIDGNLGVVAGINEMLVRSDGETIELLPALPDAMADGYISGLVAKGGFVIDMRWQNKKVVALDVRRLSNGSKPVTVKKKNLSDELVL
ncbi:MAG: glycoside hydrolase family 95 protein [Clostridiales bacterium]|jgi:alpha-L-fucosidase 2|nr:glycoside hydrolase family 95 protein [Clostridiales bacterium]